MGWQRAILDAFAHPKIREVTFIKAARLGWTEMLKMAWGYYVDQRPSPVMIVLPVLDLAKSWSKENLVGFMQACRRVGDKINEATSTVLEKVYPGGPLRLRGSNSPSGLAMISARFVAFDETDRYPRDIPAEGDPMELGKKRQATYHDGVVAAGSTPTLKYASKIEELAEESDMGHYLLRCPHCEAEHVRKFREPKQPIKVRGQDLAVSIIQWVDQDWRTAAFVCPDCGSAIEHKHSRSMIENGRWLGERWEWDKEHGFRFPHVPEGERIHIGFNLWAGYSPSPPSTPAEIVREFLRVKGNPELLRVFVNTVLGESWESAEESASAEGLMARMEPYPEWVPHGVLVLTAGVDVQADRVEVSVYGWGLNEESWLIDHEVLWGDTAEPPRRDSGIWFDLHTYLADPFLREGGGTLAIRSTAIDSGYRTQTIYEFCKHAGDRVFPVKGRDGSHPIVEDRLVRRQRLRAMRKRRRERNLELVGVDDAKSLLYRRYSIKQKGPGFCHFHDDLPKEFFDQLTSEVQEVTRIRGRIQRRWVLPAGRRNEAQDCAVYSMAAMLLLNPDFEVLQEKRAAWLAERQEQAPDIKRDTGGAANVPESDKSNETEA